VPVQSGYNKRPRKSANQLRALIRLLAKDTDAFFDDTWVVISTWSDTSRTPTVEW